jgi:hypothetical protein
VGPPLRSPGSQSIFTREACTHSQRPPGCEDTKHQGAKRTKAT